MRFWVKVLISLAMVALVLAINWLWLGEVTMLLFEKANVVGINTRGFLLVMVGFVVLLGPITLVVIGSLLLFVKRKEK